MDEWLDLSHHLPVDRRRHGFSDPDRLCDTKIKGARVLHSRSNIELDRPTTTLTREDIMLY